MRETKMGPSPYSTQRRRARKGKGEEKRAEVKMGMKFNSTAIAVVLLVFASAADLCKGDRFDVTKFGARANGKSDISKALMAAWRAACDAPSPSTVIIPKGSFALGQIILEGPCKAPITVHVDGTLEAPSTAQNFKPELGWISFNKLNGFSLVGKGVFDGNGATSWGKHCSKTVYCKNLPINIKFNFITNGLVKDITSKDSKVFHINIISCHNFTVHRFTAIAPADSPNTDGIHLGRSVGVNISESNLHTGDDCISIGDGCQHISVTKVNCGPGHGISIGSLGLYEKEDPVTDIRVVGCNLTNTDNGVRLKTFRDSAKSVASNIHFEDIIMTNVTNPIVIDQEYCPTGNCKKRGSPSRVKITDVTFKNIQGTTPTPVAVALLCSQTAPCDNVKLTNVNLKSTTAPARSVCRNVKPIIKGVNLPKACSSKE